MDRLRQISDTSSTSQTGTTTGPAYAPSTTGAAAARVGGGAAWSPAAPSSESVDINFNHQPPVPAGTDPPGSLAYQDVKFGKVPDVKFTDPNLQITTSKGTDEKAMGDNKDINFKWSVDVLKDKKNGPLYTPGLGDLQGDFTNEATTNWKYDAKLTPHGNTGKYASMKLEESGSSDGVSPSKETQYRTVDKSSGEVIRLSQLLAPEDFNKVLAKINEVQDYVPGAADYQRGQEQLRQLVDESFALYPSKDGKQTRLAVGIPSSNQSNEGNIAEYLFTMPDYFRPR